MRQAGVYGIQNDSAIIVYFYEQSAHHFFPLLNISKTSIIQFTCLMARPLFTRATPPPPFLLFGLLYQTASTVH